MLSTQVELDAASVNKVLKELKELDPKSTAKLRKDFKTRLNPFAGSIASSVPSESPFKGMRRNYYGRVQWEQPKGRVSATPAKSTRAKGWAPIVTIIVEHKSALGFAYTENAGTRRKQKRPMSREYQRKGDSRKRQHKNTTQGDFMIEKARQVSKFNFKAGHFAYGTFLSKRPEIIMLAQFTLEQVMKSYNKKVERR